MTDFEQDGQTVTAEGCDVDDLDNLCKILQEELDQNTALNAKSQLPIGIDVKTNAQLPMETGQHTGPQIPLATDIVSLQHSIETETHNNSSLRPLDIKLVSSHLQLEPGLHTSPLLLLETHRTSSHLPIETELYATSQLGLDSDIPTSLQLPLDSNFTDTQLLQDTDIVCSQLHLECHDDEANDILLSEQIEALRKANELSNGSHIDISAGESSVYRVSFPDLGHYPNNRIACDRCTKTFTRKSMVLDHQSKLHNMKDLFPCAMCSYKGQRYRLWYKHMKSKHPQMTLTHTWDQTDSIGNVSDEAPKGSDKIESLSSNGTNTKSRFDGIYKCLLCSKTFSQKRSLMYHKRTHLEKKYICSIPGCGKAFKRTSSVNEHKIKVHGDRVYKCTYASCTKMYALRRDLDYHMKSHTDTYSCEICTKSFRDQFNLAHHIKIHTGQKDIKCEYCDYKCIQRNALKSHKQRKHRDLLQSEANGSMVA